MNHDSTPLIYVRSLWRVASGSLALPIYLAGAVSLILVCLSIGRPVLAQGSVQDPALSPSIEQEYQAELEKWMLRAYEGDRDAQFRVGVLNTNSQFNPPDYEQAVYWYKQAARQGHALAQYNLGHQYLTGVGVKPNQSTAMSWWLKAAKQDHALAQFNIGRAYYLGIGLEENHTLSRKWFERAAANNEPKSIDILQQLDWTDPGGTLTAKELADSIDTDSTKVTANELTPPNIGQAGGTGTIAAASSDKTSQIVGGKIALEKQTIDESNVSSAEDLTSVVKPIDSAPTVSTTTKQGKNTNDATANQAVSALPIALYTNPALRSVLIAIVDNVSQISVQRETGAMVDRAQ